MSLLHRLYRLFDLSAIPSCSYVGTHLSSDNTASAVRAFAAVPISTSVAEKRKPMFTLSDPQYSLRFYTSIHDISTDWETASCPENRFLQRTYLETLEDNPPADMRFAYWIFYKQQHPVGVVVGQIVKFNVTENIKSEELKEKKSLVSTVKNKLTQWVAGSVGFNLLVAGSTLLTGEHAYYFDAVCEEPLRLQLLQEGLEIANKELARQQININGYLLKDFELARQTITQNKLVQQYQYSEFEFQPSMITQLREDWNTFEDYLAAMSSKYRVRAKNARKKGKELERRALSAAEIKSLQAEIYRLYQNVVDTADVNMAQLHPDYFLKLKENLREQFQLIGWFLDEQLVGFHTLIDNYHEIEAHFLGLDHQYNRSHKLYLNMLYEMTDYGITKGYKYVVFARTALEIKSSVGAEPHRMFCYVRHNKNLPNRFLKSAVSYFEPNVEWVQRHPFKGG